MNTLLISGNLSLSLVDEKGKVIDMLQSGFNLDYSLQDITVALNSECHKKLELVLEDKLGHLKDK